jgi:ABC-type phosphate/phosphonate transport system substrate-binding protein
MYLIGLLYPGILYCQSPSVDDDKTLNLIYSKSILPKVDYRDARASIEVWSKEILSDIYSEYSLNNIFIEGIDQVDEKFINEKPSFIILTALEYLTNREKLKNLIPTLLSSDDDGLVGIEYVLLVHKNSKINSLKDLKNKIVSFVDDYSNAIPHLWLDVQLKNEGLPTSDKFLKQVIIASTANQAILKTFFQQIDACIVPNKLLSTIFILNPQLESDLIVIRKSEPFIAGVVCINKLVSTNMRKNFVESAKIALKTDRGKQIALFFRTKELQDFKDIYLDNIKDLINQAEYFNIQIIH